MTFRLLFVGDVMGDAGVEAVVGLVPGLRERLALDAVVANGENSAPGGRGITAKSAANLLSVADFLTLGNHAFDTESEFLDGEPRIVRPANFGQGSPGRGWGTFGVNGVTVGVTNVLGRVFIDRAPRSPFAAAERAVEELEEDGADLIVVDVHAEATSEKEAVGYHLAGRVHAVLGTHTHVPTADARVLAGGTAYVTDVGMTGCIGSIIGFDREAFIGLFMGERRGKLPVATDGDVVLRAALVEFDAGERRATGIEPVRLEWTRRDERGGGA